MSDHITPIIVSVLYLIVYFNRARIGLFINRMKLEPEKSFLMGIKNFLSFRFDGWLKTIIFPIALMVAIYFVQLCCFHITLIDPGFSLFGRLVSVSFTAFSEELIFRGILLGIFCLYFPSFIFKMLKKEYSAWLNYTITALGLFITSTHFALQHQPVNIDRLVHGILYGLLYILSKRNLAVPVIAHSANNIINNLTTNCPY